VPSIGSIRLVVLVLVSSSLDPLAFSQSSKPGSASDPQRATVTVPKAWNDLGLSDWATPVAELDLRPSHFTEAELAKVPVYELYRSYPAYHPIGAARVLEMAAEPPP